jgi:uncharacterized protein YbaR (Trm112 family)
LIGFRSTHSHCPDCREVLKVHKTHTRGVSTLHVGTFQAREIILACPTCGRRYPSDDLSRLVPSGGRFGYDVLVQAGQALFLRYRTEEEVVAELAERNIRISASEVSVLGRKFILYLALAHQRCSPHLQEAMRRRGGYVLHLDATCDGGSPMLMSSLDSLSDIVLGNVKVPSEAEEQIVPFLERLKKTFGIPLALVHDMGSGILKAVARVFPQVPDFVCHFHFLRDIGKDLLSPDYDQIRQRLRKHEILAKLRSHAKALQRRIDPTVLDHWVTGISHRLPADTELQFLPLLSTYSLILWILDGRTQGEGYGFPFDQPLLSFAQRIQGVYDQLDQIKELERRGHWRDNMPYFDLLTVLRPVLHDVPLRQAVENIEAHLPIFERLRDALRIAPRSAGRGLNDPGRAGHIHSIEQRVNAFRARLTTRPDYPRNPKAGRLIAQLDKYWGKLFADPISVQTPSGPITVQPQRTNNIMEQFFRHLKRAHRRRTGNASSSRLLHAMLAETPLVKNLQNPAYLPLLLNGHNTLEDVFADIDIATVRQEFRRVRLHPDSIPAKIKHLIAAPDYPQTLRAMLEKAVA